MNEHRRKEAWRQFEALPLWAQRLVRALRHQVGYGGFLPSLVGFEEWDDGQVSHGQHVVFRHAKDDEAAEGDADGWHWGIKEAIALAEAIGDDVMQRDLTISTWRLEDGGYIASVVEDSWADDSEDNPYRSSAERGGSGFLGWCMHEDDREDTAFEAFVVLRANIRGFAKKGDVYEFTHSES